MANEERCEKCIFFHRLKHNFQKGKGFQESYACDVLMHLPDSKHTGDFNVAPWIQEVDTHGMCEMFTEVKQDKPTTKNNLGVDCISRERLKQIVFNITAEYDTETIHIDRLIDEIDNLPSVTQQEPKLFSIAEIKYDKDKLKELVNKAVLTVAPQEPQIFKWCDTCREYDQEKHCCHRWSKVIRDTVEEMKQEQEPKTGHWINKQHLLSSCSAECSSCHKRSNGYVHDNGFSLECKYYDFCPNCGADMREVE